MSLPLPFSRLLTVGGLTPTSLANWEAFILNCLRNLATAAAVGVNGFFLTAGAFFTAFFLALFLAVFVTAFLLVALFLRLGFVGSSISTPISSEIGKN
ncbi:MAG: hypothetical protein L3J26_13230 [Candidatus Polarisedimenticolaceae bacterium]|nr:hypothetical protein [Candidatus Polarisedimenticolaceae bacterium]